ncbi:MAG: DUF4142 domain-containing protein [Pseudomonadota bacterium]|nr:DUF4142 domain-containing protein [Pseudomonadota bacterium]
MNVNHRHTLKPFLAAMLLAGTSASAFAADADSEFLRTAALAGNFEIQAAQLARSHGTDPAVRQFAEAMLKEHTVMQSEISALATTTKIALPATLDENRSDKLKELAEADKGKSFDEKYADLMEDSHEEALELYSEAADDTKNPNILAYATSALPNLKKHEAMARKLDRRDIAP